MMWKRVRKVASLLGMLILGVGSVSGLAACVPSANSEPYTAQALQEFALPGFVWDNPDNGPVPNCGGTVCAQPLFSLYASGPVSISASEVCDEFVSRAVSAGAQSYAVFGESAWPVPTASNPEQVIAELTAFCVEGFAEGRTLAGEPVFDGLVFNDDGVADGLGKTWIISRHGDRWMLEVSFSRDRGRVGASVYSDVPPKHLTQAELDASGDMSVVAGQTMDIAVGVIGMTEDAATRLLAGKGFAVRVVSRDGVDFAVTEDYSPQRVNLSVRDGKVWDVSVG